MAWVYVLVASGFEILFALGLKYTDVLRQKGASG
jgi:multidrug transporter EmrE-like cation transporter